MTTPRIYDQALSLINTKKQWYSSEQVELAKFKDETVYVINGGKDSADLRLTYQNGGKPIWVKCGFFAPLRGWIFSLDRDTYARWVTKTGHEIAKPQQIHLHLKCAELQVEWRENGWAGI